MKRALSSIIRFKALLALAIFLCAGALSAQAQTRHQEVKVSIPFQFAIDNKVFPAGEYTVRSMTQYGQCYLIQSRDGRATKIVAAASRLGARNEASQAKLVFNVYGGQYFLSQIWTDTGTPGGELHRSRAEREIMRASVEPQIITVVASR